MESRSLNGLPNYIQQKMTFILGRPIKGTPVKGGRHIPPKSRTPRRCCVGIQNTHGDGKKEKNGKKEKKGKLKKIQNQCQYCAESACKEHTEQLCHQCIININSDLLP